MKGALKFAAVTQDGDEEGMLFLDRLPTAAEAEIIRSYLGVYKAPELSEEEIARRRGAGMSLVRRDSAEKPASAAPADSEEPLEP